MMPTNVSNFDLKMLHAKFPEEKDAELLTNQNIGVKEMCADGRSWVVHIETNQFLDALMIMTNAELWRRDFRIQKKKEQLLIEFSPHLNTNALEENNKKQNLGSI